MCVCKLIRCIPLLHGKQNRDGYRSLRPLSRIFNAPDINGLPMYTHTHTLMCIRYGLDIIMINYVFNSVLILYETTVNCCLRIEPSPGRKASHCAWLNTSDCLPLTERLDWNRINSEVSHLRTRMNTSSSPIRAKYVAKKLNLTSIIHFGFSQ
jgi:hypothetical protein